MACRWTRHAYIWQLSVGEQQRVEILKLLYRGAEILILDEPTAVLTPQEVGGTGPAPCARWSREGKSVIFITHKMDEVMAFSDRVTVLRAGTVIATLPTAETTKAELARLMVGREVLFRLEKHPARAAATRCSRCRICTAQNDKGLPALRGRLASASAQGEILGIAGVAGNGQRELAEVITGLRPSTGGQVLVCGADVTGSRPLQIDRGRRQPHPGRPRGHGAGAATWPSADNLVMKAYRTPPWSHGLFLDAPGHAGLRATR